MISPYAEAFLCVSYHAYNRASQEALTGEEKAEQQLSKSLPPHVLSRGQHFLLTVHS